MKGYKRCKCRDEAGRETGAGCLSLRRSDGSWNPSHGTWYGKKVHRVIIDGGCDLPIFNSLDKTIG